MTVDGMIHPQYKTRVSNLTMRLKCAFRISQQHGPSIATPPEPTTSLSWTHQVQDQNNLQTWPMASRSLSLPSGTKPSWALLANSDGNQRRTSDTHPNFGTMAMDEDTPLPSLVESTLSDESKDEDEHQMAQMAQLAHMSPFHPHHPHHQQNMQQQHQHYHVPPSPCWNTPANGHPHAPYDENSQHCFVSGYPMLLTPPSPTVSSASTIATTATTTTTTTAATSRPIEGILKPAPGAQTASVLGKRPQPPSSATSRLFCRKNKKKRTPLIRFDKTVQVHATYSQNDYDRQSDPEAICTRLNAALAHQIKQELNLYKTTEMAIHEESKAYTHFFV
ncbi:hypothetical protein BC940DRAFT_310042 [Gongronella butleri]|nr:hypothetical protein BC940DRAFT_310042 [Gongronella butleri]